MFFVGSSRSLGNFFFLRGIKELIQKAVLGFPLLVIFCISLLMTHLFSFMNYCLGLFSVTYRETRKGFIAQLHPFYDFSLKNNTYD